MNKSELGTLLRNIEKRRDIVELEGPTLRVTHGGTCQKDMHQVGAQLSEGATRFTGYYECPEHKDVSVIVRLTTDPDVPYELYRK